MRNSSVRAQCEMRKSFSAADRNFPTRASFIGAVQREGFTHHSFNGRPRPLALRRLVPVSYTSPVAASSLMRGARASIVTSQPFASSRVVWGPWTRKRRIISERNAALHFGSFVS